DIPDELMSVLVPGLILQPLVENAIKHGVAHSKRPVTVRISAEAQGDFLRLTVADDGEPPQRKTSCCPNSDNNNGIGRANVRARLEIRFGKQAGLKRSEEHTSELQSRENLV